jgi:glycosyltransferase involved in cell wall biosynthesis
MLPELIRRSGANVLLSAGNFALRRSPVPQILLSRNSLYTSADFYHDLRARREYRLWVDTRLKGLLAKRSIAWADRAVAPSQAFARELEQWTGVSVSAIHHGFDREAFFADSPLPVNVQQKLDAGKDALRLLFVSHYNYYRNFETLFRALPILRQRLASRKVRLYLTCRLRSEENPGPYQAEAAARLVKQLGIDGEVVELGAVPYDLLHHLYKACDVYVTAAYAETFAHPLVESMACGLPVVASDLPVHREVCEEAAVYFSRFSPQELSDTVEQIARTPALARRLSESGLKRSQEFSWRGHVEALLSLARQLLSGH